MGGKRRCKDGGGTSVPDSWHSCPIDKWWRYAESVEYAKRTGFSEDYAMQRFLGSATYRALINVETGLCYEMFEAVYEMFLEEMEEHEL